MTRAIRRLLSMSVLLLCASGPPIAAASPEQSVADRIEQRVRADASLKTQDIKVSVDDGVATLTGTVATRAQKARAARLARVKGITRVDNQLDIKAASSKTVAAKAAEKVDRAKDTVKDVGTTSARTGKAIGGTAKETGGEIGSTVKDSAKRVGEKTKDGLSRAGEEINDGWITARVKSKLRGEELLKDADVKVEASNHVVTLRGRVSSQAARARAIGLARETDGVSRVLDQLVVGK
jgi:osmotically-inducible protein OsmY